MPSVVDNKMLTKMTEKYDKIREDIRNYEEPGIDYEHEHEE